MKTKDKVQKAIANSMAIIISLVLFGINVNAQKYWETGIADSLRPIAMAVSESLKTSLESDYSEILRISSNDKILLEVETEEALEVENWMLDADLFEVHLFSVETEEPLELEEWMYNENYFLIPGKDTLVENHENLELESWMIDSKIWK